MSPSTSSSPSAGPSPAREALADAALLAVDTLLLTGAALRVTRFATTDVLGGWVLADPLKTWARAEDPRPAPLPDGTPAPPHPFGYAAPPQAWRHRLVSALDCPYCVGTQATLLISAALAALPPSTRPGRLARAACAASSTTSTASTTSSPIWPASKRTTPKPASKPASCAKMPTAGQTGWPPCAATSASNPAYSATPCGSPSWCSSASP